MNHLYVIVDLWSVEVAVELIAYLLKPQSLNTLWIICALFNASVLHRSIFYLYTLCLPSLPQALFCKNGNLYFINSSFVFKYFVLLLLLKKSQLFFSYGVC